MQTIEKLKSGQSTGFRPGLRNKLIRVMILVGALPMLLAMIISYTQGNRSLQKVIGASFQALAYETSTKIDLLMEEEMQKNQRLATHPTIVLSAMEHSRYTENKSPPEITAQFSAEEQLWNKQNAGENIWKESAGTRILKGFLNEQNASNLSTRALFITDAKGVLVSSINSYPDFHNNAKPFWKKAASAKKEFVYIGKLHQDPKLNEYVFHMALPIWRGDQKVGVFHRVYSAKTFFSTSIEPIIFGNTGHVMMINSDGVVIDCPILPTGFRLEDPTLIASVTGPQSNWSQTNGNGHGSEELSIIGYSPLLKTNLKTKPSTGEQWFTFAWQASEEVFAPTQNLFLWISAAGALSLLLIVFMGSVASNRIVQPIRALQTAAARIGRGEKVDALSIRTGDEIESLAEEINSMNLMLQQSFSGLEDQVREKSKEVLYIKEYTEKILMSVPDVLITFDENLRIEYVNPAFERLTHLVEEDAIGKPLSQIKVENRESWDSLAGELADYAKGIASERRGGSDKNISSEYHPHDPLVQKSDPQTGEPQSVLKIGDRFFTYQFFDVVIRKIDSRRIGLLMKEISEEKRLQDQLAMAEKLSGLGTLAAGIAHEMNNPLYSIMGYTEAILDENDPTKIKSHAQKVLDRSRHMASIILNLSGYSRSNVTDVAGRVDINERLDAALEIAILASYHDDIQLEKNYAELSPIKAKPEEIQQIFINIIGNAVQAMEGKGQLAITTCQENGSIQVRIRDTGPGIAPAHLSRIFDPFFTTKDQGKGTGLGLNIVHRMVIKYGGRIDVQSSLGEGTTFNITFPVSPQ